MLDIYEAVSWNTLLHMEREEMLCDLDWFNENAVIHYEYHG